MAGALDGVSVLEMSWYASGPYCGRLLALAGATVTKVERPDGGDPARSFPSSLFDYLNTGKRSVTLNLKTEEGRDLTERLIAQSDLVVENFSPRVLPGVGLGFERMQQLNPRVVLVSISNFGQSGPYRDFRSADVVAYALGGLLGIQGEIDKAPLRHWGRQAQYQAGSIAAVGATAALFHQRRTGTGQHVDVSLQEAVASLMESHVEFFTHAGQVRKRSGNRYQWTYPVTLYPCKDGHIVVNAGTPRTWEPLCTLVGREDLKTDPDYTTSMGRVQRANEIDAMLDPWLMARTRQELWDLARQWLLPWGPVNEMGDILRDPQHVEREYLVSVKQPDGSTVTMPGAPVRLQRTPLRADQPPPSLGAHNEKVYCGELGLSREALETLQANGTV